MKTYRITLETLSATLTPYQADTIFGHLCWSVERQGGAAALMKFLAPFLAGSPPFLLSDGFPEGWLTKPAVVYSYFDDPAVQKQLKRLAYLTVGDFCDVCSGKGFAYSPDQPDAKSVVSTHNTMDRCTNTTMQEGGMYTLEEWETLAITVYLKASSDEWRDRVLELFTDLSQGGYGRKKTIGKGQFKVNGLTEAPELSGTVGADGFVTLNSFCPASGDPTEGSYQAFVKYGKLGEIFTFCGNPFKKPLLMLKTGSVFKTAGAPADYYGRMVAGVSPAKPEVVQYAYAFAVPIKYPNLALK